MKIFDLIKKNHIGKEKAIHKDIMGKLRFLCDNLENNAVNPESIYYNWFKGKNSHMAIIAKALANDYDLIVHPGFYKVSDSTFIQSAKQFSLKDYIKSKYNYSFYYDSEKKHALCYNQDIYKDLVTAGISMLINKFDISTITMEHIMFQILMTLFTYFRIYEKKDEGNEFVIETNNIKDTVYGIINMDIEFFDDFAKSNGFYYDSTAEYVSNYDDKSNKPKCKEDIEECFVDGMNQTQKKEAIMKAWRCSSSTARNYMRKYGFTDLKYSRKRTKNAIINSDNI